MKFASRLISDEGGFFVLFAAALYEQFFSIRISNPTVGIYHSYVGVINCRAVIFSLSFISIFPLVIKFLLRTV